MQNEVKGDLPAEPSFYKVALLIYGSADEDQEFQDYLQSHHG